MSFVILKLASTDVQHLSYLELKQAVFQEHCHPASHTPDQNFCICNYKATCRNIDICLLQTRFTWHVNQFTNRLHTYKRSIYTQRQRAQDPCTVQTLQNLVTLENLRYFLPISLFHPQPLLIQIRDTGIYLSACVSGNRKRKRELRDGLVVHTSGLALFRNWDYLFVNVFLFCLATLPRLFFSISCSRPTHVLM